MKKMNLYFAQLGEAISLANSHIFEYKRISLILFDNIVENLLRMNATSALNHSLVMGNIDKCDYKNTINGFNMFGNIIEQAKRCEILSKREAEIISFCHKSRNKLYHELYEKENVTEYCILFYAIFLKNNFIRLLETGITSYSDKSTAATETIKRKENIEELEELPRRLHTYISLSSTSPQKILAEILMDYIGSIEEFYENDTQQDWNELNKIIKKQYFFDFEIKKKKKKNIGVNYSSIIPEFKREWYDLNGVKLSSFKLQIIELEKIDIELSFEKFQKINKKLEPIYIGIMLYQSEQEYHASLSDD